MISEKTFLLLMTSRMTPQWAFSQCPLSTVNFELGKKAFDDKSGLYTYISFHPPPHVLEKIEERVSEGDTIEVLIVMTQRGKIRFKDIRTVKQVAEIFIAIPKI